MFKLRKLHSPFNFKISLSHMKSFQGLFRTDVCRIEGRAFDTQEFRLYDVNASTVETVSNRRNRGKALIRDRTVGIEDLGMEVRVRELCDMYKID